MTELLQDDSNFLGYEPNALRYDSCDPAPTESHGSIVSLIPLNAKVLDIGCGTGIIGRILQNRTQDVTYVGIDSSRERTLKACSYGLNVRNATLNHQTICSLGRFDTIILADVIEHLHNPRPLVAFVRDLLSEGGRIILSVPNVAHWSIRLSLLMGSFDYTETASWMPSIFAGLRVTACFGS